MGTRILSWGDGNVKSNCSDDSLTLLTYYWSEMYYYIFCYPNVIDHSVSVFTYITNCLLRAIFCENPLVTKELNRKCFWLMCCKVNFSSLLCMKLSLEEESGAFVANDSNSEYVYLWPWDPSCVLLATGCLSLGEMSGSGGLLLVLLNLKSISHL